MKKTKLVLIAAVLGLTMLSASCGKKADTAGTSTSSDETTAASALSEDDPEVKKLEETKESKPPKLSKMGKIKLADLSSITVGAAPEEALTDDAVEEQINAILSQELSEVEDSAQNGDTVNIDFTGTIDGVAFDGGAARGEDLQLGSGAFIPGFEEQLVGHKKGDNVSVKATFPADYGKPELNGKAAVFEVVVNAVKRKPELTDEWVRTNDKVQAQTVEEFRTKIRDMLQASYDYSYHSGIQQQAISQIIEKSEITVSDALQKYAEDYVISQQINSMKQYGYKLSDLLNMYGMSVKDFKTEMSSQATEYAKQYFVIQKIAEDQGIKLSDELIDKLAENISAMMGQDLDREKLIETYGKSMVENEAISNAVLSYIETQTKITAETPEEAAANAAEEGPSVAESGAESAVEGPAAK